MCNEKELYIEKAIGANMKRFKVRRNQHISDRETGDSTYQSPCHVYDCGIKNNCLEELFFGLNIMLNKQGSN